MAIKRKTQAAKISAAGILFVCKGQLLLIMRSAEVVDPSVWCGAGGKIEPGETPEEAAIREASEEIGYVDDGELQLTPLYVYNSDSLIFHNFIGLLPKERFNVSLNWESDGYAWFTMDNLPENALHYGFQAILSNSEAASLLHRTIDESRIPDWKDK